jgi:hypothetical protein
MTLFQALISQVNLFLFVSAFLMIERIMLKDDRDVIDMIPEPFDNIYFSLFMLIIWFVVFTWGIYYFQLPEYGIWSYLFKYSHIMGIVILSLVLTFDIHKVMNRKR